MLSDITRVKIEVGRCIFPYIWNKQGKRDITEIALVHRNDLESGNVQIKQATMSNGDAIISAFGLGFNINGIITSCMNFMDKANVDRYAKGLGIGIDGIGAAISIYQTIIVCYNGDTTTENALAAISAALDVAAFFLPAGMAITGIVGISSCIIGLVSTFVTTSLPSEIHIQLEDGTNVSIYIINNQISPIIA